MVSFDKKNTCILNAKKRQYRCYVCEEIFVSARLLRAHEINHHPVLYKCIFCDMPFAIPSRGRYHLKTKHCKEFDLKSIDNISKTDLCSTFLYKEWACGFCDYKTNNFEQYKIHYLEHTAKSLLIHQPKEAEGDK